MITPFGTERFPKKPILPASKREVFIGLDTMSTSLARVGVTPLAAKGLWSALDYNTGVRLAQNGQVEEIIGGRLHCVRALGNLPLVSVDGLMDGLADDQELWRDNRGLGPQRIANIIYLGMIFTPDRRDEITQSIGDLDLPPAHVHGALRSLFEI